MQRGFFCFFVLFCFVLQKSWDQEAVIYLKKKELDFGDLEGLLTALAMLKHREFALVPLKIEKKKISYRLWRCRKVLEQRSEPSWASRSLVSGHENKFEFNLQSLASDPQMGFAEGLVTLAFYRTLSCLLD